MSIETTRQAITEACQRAQAPLDRSKMWLEDMISLLESAVDMGWTPEHRKKAIQLVGLRRTRRKP